ncbi:MAG TPA: molybdopterin-binding/glycosyltransferase family 2 protein [Rhizomicrobium sp.]|nr:molybdopterin-binding/glycosyltransferase family 2 protein [Rhizomicrobium sp.]
MQFGTTALDDTAGTILGHSVRAGERLFRKGRLLSAADIETLRAAGVREIVVARLEAGDVPENEAAARIASACAGDRVRAGAAFTGRANLYAETSGLALVDAALVDAINAIDESITIATVRPFARVDARQMLATIKIIPFAAPRVCVEAAEAVLRAGTPLQVATFVPKRAALISTTLPGDKPSLLDKNRKTIEERLTAIGSSLVAEHRVPHEAEALAEAIRAVKDADPILILGASAITDRRDAVPAAIEAAGGTIDALGMPVDPGNLLLVGRVNAATVVGLPGCARSPKQNGFDWVLWRIAANLPVGRKEIAAMGVGGLLNEIATRPQPRDERPLETSGLPRIAAIVLAAGLSSRMGSNKLLAEIDGKPLVRRSVEAALSSSVDCVIVVTGNRDAEVGDALAGLDVTFANNPDFSKGLSESLKRGISTVPQDYDGALVLLGDMPDVTVETIDRLIAAFDPAEDRAICVATRAGKRGNPVLWARRFFPAMMAIEGDVGAKHLMAANDELVCEVEADDDGPLIDIDTPEALAAYRAR